MTRTVSLIAIAGLLVLASSAQADPAPDGVAPDLSKVAGVYKHRFENGDVAGNSFRSEDIFELVKLTPKTAYFRIHTEFFNGHECNLFGVADLMPDALTYFGPPDFEGKPCVMKFRATPTGLTMEDVNGACRLMSCGARGGYASGKDPAWVLTARRAIRYMPRLKASHEFADALKEHAAHPVGTPAPQS